MKAEEAKELSIQCLRTVETIELNNIFERVKSACEKGRFAISLDKPISITTKTKLQNMGYTIKECDSQREGYSIDVSWV